MACALAGLALLSPVLATLALWILLCDGAPVLFSQMRVGRLGKHFRIWKFRTMRPGAAGGSITAAGDTRITAAGAVLRKFKLDELPQLFNVLRGDMSLVGPRPEMPEYVDRESPMWQAVLQVPPGITDLATLVYRDEEALLSAHSDTDRFYREAVLPAKLRLNLAYLQNTQPVARREADLADGALQPGAGTIRSRAHSQNSWYGSRTCQRLLSPFIGRQSVRKKSAKWSIPCARVGSPPDRGRRASSASSAATSALRTRLP